MAGRSKTFTKAERDTLLSVKGVGPIVIARLEQLGITNLEKLSCRDAQDICAEAAGLVGSTCWKNSPQARNAIAAAIDAAKYSMKSRS
jgi:hypothetical protein